MPEKRKTANLNCSVKISTFKSGLKFEGGNTRIAEGHSIFSNSYNIKHTFNGNFCTYRGEGFSSSFLTPDFLPLTAGRGREKDLGSEGGNGGRWGHRAEFPLDSLDSFGSWKLGLASVKSSVPSLTNATLCLPWARSSFCLLYTQGNACSAICAAEPKRRGKSTCRKLYYPSMHAGGRSDPTLVPGL